MNSKIFQSLIEAAQKSGDTIAHSDKARWIKKLDDTDSDLMSKANIRDARKITNQLRAVSLEYGARLFVALFGFFSAENFPDGLPNGLWEIDVTPGLFNIAVTQTGITPSATPSEIKEVVEGEYIGVDGYEGHELASIALLFPHLIVVEADSNYEYTRDIDRIIGAVIGSSHFNGSLPLDDSTLKALTAIFVDGAEYIPFMNVLQGMLSIFWSTFFVDLYRCIEQLYAVPKILELRNHWATDRSIADLSYLLEFHLAWRPKEDESIAKIIGECSEKSVGTLVVAFDLDAEKLTKPAEVVARRIYETRNGIVHFRSATKVASFPDNKWNEIARGMLQMIAECYDKYGHVYHKVNVIANVESA